MSFNGKCTNAVRVHIWLLKPDICVLEVYTENKKDNTKVYLFDFWLTYKTFILKIN